MTTDAETHAAQTSAPAVKSGVVPYLLPSDAREAAAFYVRAFAAEEVARNAAEDGRLMHCHLYINGGSVMMSDCFPEYGHPAQAPQGAMLHLEVGDADAWWTRAVDAGCEVVTPLELQFWGQRYGQIRDPFGYVWSMSQR
jgi:PhnB protein